MDTVGIDDVIAEVCDWATGEGVDQLVTCQAGRRCSYVSRLLEDEAIRLSFFIALLYLGFNASFCPFSENMFRLLFFTWTSFVSSA